MVQVNGWVNIPDAYANAVFAGAGWDSITLDAQHGLFDERALIDTLHALSAKTPKRLVRVAWNEPALVGKALDFGADGLIVPLINSVEEARRLAEACRYPPAGKRSFGPGLAALRAGGVPYETLVEGIEIWAMIETAEALEAVRGIAEVPGIDGLFVGPNDLALSLGLAPGSNREEPRMMQAFETIVMAARDAGKMSGIFCTNPAYAARMGRMGFSMVTAAVDSAILAEAAARIVAEARA